MKQNIKKQNGALSCTKFKQCGGCSYKEDYAKQLEIKQQTAVRKLGAFGKVDSIIGMDKPYRYRCKVTRVYKRANNGRIIAGLFKSKSLTLVPISDCMLEDKRLCEIASSLCALFESFKIEPFDFKTGKGELRHVLLRKGHKTGQIMLCIVTNRPALKSPRAFGEAVRERFPDVTTLIHNECKNPMPLTLGQRENILFGQGYIEDELCGLRFKISAGSFAQVNPEQTQVLYSLAREMLENGTGTLLDAYCGTGTIGLICSGKAKRVIGAELTPSAVKDAQANARLNSIKNAEFICTDAGKLMKQTAESGQDIDAVILDPPRAGADRRFLESLIALAPKQVIYISCNAQTLCRDLRILKQGGYKAERIQPVDMFCHTRHMETVAGLYLR